MGTKHFCCLQKYIFTWKNWQTMVQIWIQGRRFLVNEVSLSLQGKPQHCLLPIRKHQLSSKNQNLENPYSSIYAWQSPNTRIFLMRLMVTLINTIFDTVKWSVFTSGRTPQYSELEFSKWAIYHVTKNHALVKDPFKISIYTFSFTSMKNLLLQLNFMETTICWDLIY